LVITSPFTLSLRDFFWALFFSFQQKSILKIILSKKKNYSDSKKFKKKIFERKFQVSPKLHLTFSRKIYLKTSSQIFFIDKKLKLLKE